MKSYRVGTICLATNQGLGYLAKDFYDNGIIDEVYVHKHTSRTNHYEWYPNRVQTIDELLEKIDILLMFETPFEWKVIPKARAKGIKTVLMPMYECTYHPFPYEPDQIWCPSDLDMKFYQDKGHENCVRVDVPVDVAWKQREKALVFVHNAGNGGLGGRNGTAELIKAMEYVKSPIKLIIRSQSHEYHSKDERITFVNTSVPKEELWNEGDVFVFPEKFNGLSLPIQEAFASGMLVMASMRFPNTSYLPLDPLIPVKGYKQERISVIFESAIIDPIDIAKTIDVFYNRDITNYSNLGKKFGEKMSWKIQKEKYEALMSQLLGVQVS